MKEYKRLLLAISQVPAPIGLRDRVVLHLRQAERKVALRNVIVLGISSCVSGILLFPAFQFLLREIAQSGFGEYLSLAFSDGGAVLGYWQEFTLTLAESFPVFGVTVVFALLFGLLASLRNALANVDRMSLRQDGQTIVGA